MIVILLLKKHWTKKYLLMHKDTAFAGKNTQMFLHKVFKCKKNQ